MRRYFSLFIIIPVSLIQVVDKSICILRFSPFISATGGGTVAVEDALKIIILLEKDLIMQVSML